MTAARVALASLSAAMDGGFTAIADVSQAMASVGAAGDYRLIGGVTVMLHVQRLGLDLPLRATGDADFGVPPHVLRRPNLIGAIEARGYHKVFGNRWERDLDERRVAAVDLLVPAYRSVFATPSGSAMSSRPRCRDPRRPCDARVSKSTQSFGSRIAHGSSRPSCCLTASERSP